MSTLRKEKRILEESNQLLGQELGRNPHGVSRYLWRFSESWVRSKRAFHATWNEELIPEFDYAANPDTGIIEAKPKYIKEKVCLELTNQYVMSLWLPTEGFHEWRMHYGDALEWPKHGDWWPVSHPMGVVSLDIGVVPTTDITWEFIHQVRKDKAELAEYEARKEAAEVSRDKAETDRLVSTIMDVMPVYFGVPGSRSFGNWPIAETKQDARITDNIWLP